MRHILAISVDSTRIVHYNPSKELVTVHKLPQKPSTHTVTPLETLSTRSAPITSLCIHPTLPIFAAIPYKSLTSNVYKVPKGPSAIDQTTISNTKTILKNKFSIVLYTHYTSKALNYTTLTIELPSVTDDDASLTPWCMKYSQCGRYLAIHTRTYSSNIATIHQLHILDTKTNYDHISSVKIDSGIEDIEWSPNNNILAACTDGQLRIFLFDENKDRDHHTFEINFQRSYNLSSSPLSALTYNINESALLVGTRDGNTFYIDPTTMCCIYSELANIDLPVLSISIGPMKTCIITYISEHAHILRITNDKFENLKEVNDLCNTYSTGCGAFCTQTGFFIYVNLEGTIIFKTLNSLIASETTKNNKRTNNNSKKRPLDLFDDSTTSPIKHAKTESNTRKESYDQQREYWNKTREQHTTRLNRDRYIKKR
jgi:WD40 repeat protein